MVVAVQHRVEAGAWAPVPSSWPSDTAIGIMGAVGRDVTASANYTQFNVNVKAYLVTSGVTY